MAGQQIKKENQYGIYCKTGKILFCCLLSGYRKKRQQVWESGLSYSTAKSRKAQIEHEQATNIIPTADSKDMTVSEFLYEFIEKYGLKKWRASTYDGNSGLLENYVHPYLGDKKLRSIKTKAVDDYYHFLETEAEPATNMGKPMRDHITAATIHDIHKVLRCAFNLAVLVFHSLRHTSATTKLLMSGGDYNSVMQAGGWSNLEMLTRRYGKHSFASEREKLAGKMDDFLDGKGISEPQKNDKDEANSAEQVLQQLMKSNPELLIEFARSIQNANKE